MIAMPTAMRKRPFLYGFIDPDTKHACQIIVPLPMDVRPSATASQISACRRRLPGRQRRTVRWAGAVSAAVPSGDMTYRLGRMVGTNANYRVGVDCAVSLPLLGPIDAAGFNRRGVG